MLRRSTARAFVASRALLEAGHAHGHVERFQDKEFPNQPHGLTKDTHDWGMYKNNLVMSKLLDQNAALYDDQVTGTARAHYQDPARAWHCFNVDDTLIMEEHDKEEWNDKPYVTVNHLYEPPVGCEDRPIRVEAHGNPGDIQMVACLGNCAPHVPTTMYVMLFKGYFKNKCALCQQFFYVHNRPWLIMHPDWTDEPAADEGPAYTFAEIESEFDRDFHEFSVYLNIE